MKIEFGDPVLQAARIGDLSASRPARVTCIVSREEEEETSGVNTHISEGTREGLKGVDALVSRVSR